MNTQVKNIRIDWTPQPRQLACIKACGLSKPFDGAPLTPAVADLVGYGGAAGGGKTDTDLAVAILAATQYPGINIGYFRREFPQLEGPGGAIMRSREMIGHFAKYNEQKKRWTIPTGKKNDKGQPLYSILQFNHCKDPADVYNYQSLQFDIIILDEATQFEKDMIKYLLTRNRATVDYPTFKPFSLLSTNPGNVGHQYFKDEFVTLGTPEKVNIFINESGDEEKHIFIPSKLTDNFVLMKRDPGYARRLGSTEVNRKVLLEGDWDVFAGQAFNELSRDVHLIDPIEIKDYWTRFGAYDHGFNHPFSFGVYVVNDDGEVFKVAQAKNRLMKPYQVAQEMMKAANSVGGILKLSYIVAGHDCWNRGRDGSPSIADIFANLDKYYPTLKLPKIRLRQANIARVAGATHMREFITYKGIRQNEKGEAIDGTPRFYMFKQCQSTYDTLARMIFDTDGSAPEDVKKVDADENGGGGDDEYDETRYALMSRPKPTLQKKTPAPFNSVMGIIQEKARRRALEGEYVGW